MWFIYVFERVDLETLRYPIWGKNVNISAPCMYLNKKGLIQAYNQAVPSSWKFLWIQLYSTFPRSNPHHVFILPELQNKGMTICYSLRE